MTQLLAEDLLLLLLDDERGTMAGTPLDPRIPLGAAVLAELAFAGAVELEPKGSFWQTRKVLASDGPAVDDVLRDALAVVAEKPRTAGALAWRIGGGLKERLGDRLVARGVLERREDRVLGLFPRTRWPSRSVADEAALRARLEDVVVRGVAPDERTAALAGILQALDRLNATLGLKGAEAREAQHRVKELAHGDWATAVVREAVQAAVVASMTAVTAGSAVVVAGS